MNARTPTPLFAHVAITHLAVKSVTKRFTTRPAIENVSFDLHVGEVLGVIGPSGCGKTTLLRCLLGLEEIEHGSIEICPSPAVLVQSGDDIRPTAEREVALHAARQRIGIVFQDLNLWEDRTVRDNLLLAPTVVRRERRADALWRAEVLCHRFQLPEKMSSRIWQLSGGERQRVAIVRALMMNPELLLLDEVTSALDPVLTMEVMGMIQDLKAQRLSMILVTHHIEFATQVCDRVLFLSKGQVVQIDTPDQILSRPTTDEVGRFLSVLRTAR